VSDNVFEFLQDTINRVDAQPFPSERRKTAVLAMMGAPTARQNAGPPIRQDAGEVWRGNAVQAGSGRWIASHERWKGCAHDLAPASERNPGERFGSQGIPLNQQLHQARADLFGLASNAVVNSGMPAHYVLGTEGCGWPSEDDAYLGTPAFDSLCQCKGQRKVGVVDGKSDNAGLVGKQIVCNRSDRAGVLIQVLRAFYSRCMQSGTQISGSQVVLEGP
jgi:hypothetical protein